jgi:predicted ribosome quality control (RQC) complex YloA/Tae2 family protein
MKEYVFNGITILLGENAKENSKLLDCDPEYYWIHLSSFSSGHIIVKHSNPDEETLKYAAMLCKKNTKYRNLKNVKVDCTRRNNLAKSEKVGEVYIISLRRVRSLKV